jgi:Mrp family chromosome partitioning ATPase
LKVLAITSAQAGDGKTTVASNLATSFALSGFDVVLISGDLRRGTIDDRFPVDAACMGLTDLLAARKREDHIRSKVTDDGLTADLVDRTPATAALQPTRTNGLRILAAGSPTQQPAELLGSPQFSDLILELRDLSDIVVIDCPPAIVADTLLLARVADSTVIIASVGRTQRKLLGDATDRLRAAQAQLLGVVANRVGANRRGYYGRYGYYNRYGSYYGTYTSSSRTTKGNRRAPKS